MITFMITITNTFLFIKYLYTKKSSCNLLT